MYELTPRQRHDLAERARREHWERKAMEDKEQQRKWLVARLHGVIAMFEDAQSDEETMASRVQLMIVTKEFDEFILKHTKRA